VPSGSVPSGGGLRLCPLRLSALWLRLCLAPATWLESCSAPAAGRTAVLPRGSGPDRCTREAATPAASAEGAPRRAERAPRAIAAVCTVWRRSRQRRYAATRRGRTGRGVLSVARSAACC